MRIRKEGNYIVITDNNNKEVFNAHASKTFFVKNESSEIDIFDNIETNLTTTQIRVLESELKDEVGADLAGSPITWLRDNTGFNAASGGSGAVQGQIDTSTSLNSGSNGIHVFCNPVADIDITIDHLALADKHENYFINESAFNVTFVPSVANSTNVIATNALILEPNGTAYLIRKGSENKIYLKISN
tara:strand:+ start:739 stop:1302 length:564 start_codon:yes stop_codon:yes gene_type:complete